MSSLFFGIELGRRALSAFRQAIDTTGHNVSNVNTPGYHLQSPILSSTDPYAMPSLSQTMGAYQMGTGVEVSKVNRHYDSAIEMRIRELLSTQENYNVNAQFLSQIESINSLQSGVSQTINDFFNAFQEVSNNPESVTNRTVVIQKGVALSQEVNYLAKTLINTRSDVNDYIKQNITEANDLLKQVRDLNSLIKVVSGAGDAPNDLLDQRDVAINELRKYADVQVSDQANNGIIVYIGGRAVVQDDEYLTLTGVPNAANSNYVDIKFSDDLAGPNATILDGKLKGLIDLRDDTSKGLLFYKQQVDTFASSFITAVNTAHTAGFDLNGVAGVNFFSPVVAAEPALNMQVDAPLLNALNGPSLVAAASAAANVPGDGSNALAIARLATTAVIGTFTPSDFMAQFVSNLGANVKDINAKKTATDNLMIGLENIRDSISGVSLDSEATYLTQYEKAFQAAAKIVSMYDGMIQDVLDMVQ